MKVLSGLSQRPHNLVQLYLEYNQDVKEFKNVLTPTGMDVRVTLPNSPVGLTAINSPDAESAENWQKRRINSMLGGENYPWETSIVLQIGGEPESSRPKGNPI